MHGARKVDTILNGSEENLFQNANKLYQQVRDLATWSLFTIYNKNCCNVTLSKFVECKQ